MKESYNLMTVCSVTEIIKFLLKKWRLGKGAYGEIFKVKTIYDNKFYAVKKIKFKKKDEKMIRHQLELNSSISQFIEINLMVCYSFWLENNFNIINGRRISENTITLYLHIELCQQSLTGFLESIKKIKNENKDLMTNLKYYASSVILSQILEGVKFLHKQTPPIIHRDLCPDNILILYEENDRTCVKIADFGLATIHRFAEKLHEAKDSEHIEYIAPQVINSEKFDTKSDIFSLGIILKDLFDIDSYDKYDFLFDYFSTYSMIIFKYFIYSLYSS